jgi:hypothetical protein
VTDDNVRHVEDQVRRKADEFIKDYQVVNPDGEGAINSRAPRGLPWQVQPDAVAMGGGGYG